MKKNEEMKEETTIIRKECLVCPENRDCPFAEDETQPAVAASTEKPDMQDESCLETDELRELDDAVSELVDSLFNVIDKVAEAARYLKKLDELTDAALDYLSAIGTPMLSQED